MPNTKKCTKCQETFPVSDFYKDKAQSSGLTSQCKHCYAAYYRENREQQQASIKRVRVKRKYGLTVEEYDALLSGGCDICGRDDVRLVLDHCHESGEVRGGICSPCNFLLGNVKDNPETLRRLADFVEGHNAGSG